MGLGSAAIVRLTDAREKATAARKARHGDDLNPITARERDRRAGAAIPTFKQVAADFIAAREGEWKKPKHVAQWKMTLAEYCKPLHALPVNEITTADVLANLQPIWSTKGETARRIPGRIEMILDRQRTIGHIDANARNPAQWKGRLDMALKRKKGLKRGHHAAPPYDQLPELLRRVRKLDTTAALALEFTILTAARTGESLGGAE
jgi:hypothetical protein